MATGGDVSLPSSVVSSSRLNWSAACVCGWITVASSSQSSSVFGVSAPFDASECGATSSSECGATSSSPPRSVLGRVSGPSAMDSGVVGCMVYLPKSSSKTTSRLRITFSPSGSHIRYILLPSYPTSLPGLLRSSNLASCWRRSFGMWM